MRWFFLLVLSASPAFALKTDLALVKTDISALLKQALLNDKEIEVSWSDGSENRVKFSCKKTYALTVTSKPEEQISTAYQALKNLGFLFPHPRRSVIPDKRDVLKLCGRSWEWKPLLKDRGFHLHTQHGSEWVSGFFMGSRKIAEDMLWWLARNQQNLVQVQTIRIPDEQLKENLTPLIALSHRLGIRFGMSFSFAMIQQKNYYLVPLWRALTGIGDEEALKSKIREMADLLDFDYVTSELGTTEFTRTNEEKTIRWMNLVQSELAAKGRGYFIKSHVSSNQHSEKYGNFNFLPQFADPKVGVQAHTVMHYSLNDSAAPVYGRKDFHDMKEFILQEKGKRPLWYFPETSYYCGVDIDVPLFLTDFLVARADDMKFIAEHGVSGQVNFSTGQELGYWLFDWTVALLNDSGYKQDPLTALRLLGEDTAVWDQILKWQTEFIKNRQLIQALSTSTLLDELPFAERVHQRVLLRELPGREETLKKQISDLREAIRLKPDFTKVKDTELRAMLRTLSLRFRHALKLREALLGDRERNLDEAAKIREAAFKTLSTIKMNYSRYPESFVFQELQRNPTSYAFGYGWTAVNLIYWEREEKMIRWHQTWNPFFMNIWNPVRILF